MKEGKTVKRSDEKVMNEVSVFPLVPSHESNLDESKVEMRETVRETMGVSSLKY